MPFYLRKQPLEIPLPTEKEWIKKDEGEAFFLNDPDQIIDYLPQPFQMINRLVTVLFEQAWDIIENREQRHVSKKRHPPPVSCQPLAEFQVVGKANCLAASGEYIFIGLSTGLSVFSIDTCERVCAWDAVKLEMCTLHISDLGNNSEVLGTVDEMGFAHLFYFSKEILLHVKAINEVEDVSKRNTCVALELSPRGDYAGFLLQGSSEAWLEVYRLPKDSWQKEIEHVQTVSLAPPVLSSTPASAKDRKFSIASTPKNVDFRGLDVPGEVTEEQDLQQLLNQCKLSPPALLMKIRSPKPVAGSPFKNPYEALMKCDDGTTVGLGQNHLIRDCQWERLDCLFNSTFRQFLDVKDELEIKEEKLSQGMFHFHGPGRTLPIGTENRTEPDAPVALSVHWSTSHHLCFYLLSRPPKEKTDSDPKPDIVWPCAAPVVLSAVTPCFSHLALVCEDGAITVWDKSLGFALFVTVLPEGYVVRSIQFMPLASKTVSHSKDSATRKVQLLVLCTDGSLHLLTSETKEFSTKVLVYKPEHPSQAISAIATVPSLTNAVLTCSWDGTVSLTDTATEATVCHFITPPPFRVTTPWHPVFTVDSNGQYLILQGYEPSGSIKAESGSDQNTIFLFDVTPCPEIFSQPDECPPDSLEHLPWDRRCDVFLKNSYQQLSTISQQIPESWSLLQRYAATLQGMGHEK